MSTVLSVRLVGRWERNTLDTTNLNRNSADGASPDPSREPSKSVLACLKPREPSQGLGERLKDHYWNGEEAQHPADEQAVAQTQRLPTFF